MAKKRFTDIEIWDKEWYMDLSPKHKCLMKYIFDKCDASGCWKPNWKLASMHINDKVELKDLKLLPQDQYEILPNGKIFIPDFIAFQYGKLSRECRPHIPIITTIEKNELYDRLSHLIEDSGTSVKALRKRLTETAKRELFEEDDYQCQYCGERDGYNNLFADHIVPLIFNGTNSPDNLTTSCKSCNSKKHDDDVFEFIEKYKLTPLYNLSKKLNTLYKKRNTLKEKDKEKEKDMDKEEEKESGNIFVNFPMADHFNGLPEVKIGSVIQLFKYTKQVDVSNEQVIGLWEVFKVQNLTGKKHYNTKDDVYSHFLNWVIQKKIEKATKDKTDEEITKGMSDADKERYLRAKNYKPVSQQ